MPSRAKQSPDAKEVMEERMNAGRTLLNEYLRESADFAQICYPESWGCWVQFPTGQYKGDMHHRRLHFTDHNFARIIEHVRQRAADILKGEMPENAIFLTDNY